MIPQIIPDRKTQSIKNYAVTRRARQLYAYIQAHGPVTRRDALRAVWGEAYLTAPWRNNFAVTLRGARLYAAQFGEAIVPTGPGYHRPLMVMEATDAETIIRQLGYTHRPGRGRRARRDGR